LKNVKEKKARNIYDGLRGFIMDQVRFERRSVDDIVPIQPNGLKRSSLERARSELRKHPDKMFYLHAVEIDGKAYMGDAHHRSYARYEQGQREFNVRFIDDNYVLANTQVGFFYRQKCLNQVKRQIKISAAECQLAGIHHIRDFVNHINENL